MVWIGMSVTALVMFRLLDWRRATYAIGQAMQSRPGARASSPLFLKQGCRLEARAPRQGVFPRRGRTEYSAPHEHPGGAVGLRGHPGGRAVDACAAGRDAGLADHLSALLTQE